MAAGPPSEDAPPPRRLTRRQLLVRTALGLAITGAFAGVLLSFVEPAQLRALALTTRWELIALGFGVFVGVHLLRTLRFQLLAPRTGFGLMWSITAVHNLMLRVLPLRTGELSYALLVRRAGTASFGGSLAGLALLRLLDMTLVICIFGVTLATAGALYQGDSGSALIWTAVAAAVGASGVLLFRTWFALGARVARWAAARLGVASRPRVAHLLDRLDGVVAEVAATPRRALAVQIGVSTLMWLAYYLEVYVLTQAFGLPVSLEGAILGGTAATVTGFLPLSGIGSFGPLEAGWALGFGLVGVSQGAAVASAFGFSLATFAYTAAHAAIGWVVVSRRGRAAAAAP